MVSMTTTSPLGRTFYCGALNVKEMWGFSEFFNRRIKLVLHQNRPPKNKHLHWRIFAAAYWHFLPLLGKPSSWCGLLECALGAWCKLSLLARTGWPWLPGGSVYALDFHWYWAICSRRLARCLARFLKKSLDGPPTMASFVLGRCPCSRKAGFSQLAVWGVHR